MDDQVDLQDIWRWLPTFRAVAETEHLPTASKRLHVTPAAISRTIKLLEDRLGKSLFNRGGKRLVLNADGQALLEAVTEAMSQVEQGLDTMREVPLSGPVRISSVGVLTNHYVTPALVELTDANPGLRPELRNLRTADAAEQLLGGTVDVAFIYESMTLEGIHVEQLGRSPSSVYCGREHPLFGRDEVTLQEVTDHPFSVPQLGDTGQVMDGWPADVPRQVGMTITLLTTNVEVCRSGRFLTVLPDVTARTWVQRGEMRRLDVDVVPPAVLFAARREAARRTESRAQAVIDAVGQRVKRLEKELAQFRAQTG